MSEQYNSEVSKHYAAYRPPLHSMILSDMLAGQSKFKTGLDIGCGTGVSSIALSEFCDEVIGIEPSKAILEKAVSQESIRYLEGAGEQIPVEDCSVDLVSFAGSLFYANSDALVEELVRVCRPNAFVAVYDFDVILTPYMALLGVADLQSNSDYNHAENFEGRNELKALEESRGQIQLTMTSRELAHVLFASSHRYTALAELFGCTNVFAEVVEVLDQFGNEHQITVDTYYSTYQINA